MAADAGTLKLSEVREFLKSNIRKEVDKYYGGSDESEIDRITDNWFNDAENYDGRWGVIGSRTQAAGTILDMAAGCGTFVLNGLQRGHDVRGIEPETWKMDYFRKKIAASGYPDQWNERIVRGVGEALPFEDGSFDLVTTYQTLEHVGDVDACLQEMLRVVKVGGVLYIRAPDYNCFYEPHYRVPFLPTMNRRLAAFYLKAIGRPTSGLDTLNWTTEAGVIESLKRGNYRLTVDRASMFHTEARRGKIRRLLPGLIGGDRLVAFLDALYVMISPVFGISGIGRREKNIDLWVTKLA